MIPRSSMQAMTLTVPPHSRQVSMSILNTRFSRCAQVMADRRPAGVWSCASYSALCLLPLRTMPAVGREHPVEEDEVDLWLGHQWSGQIGRGFAGFNSVL